MNPSNPCLEDDPWVGLSGGLEARLGHSITKSGDDRGWRIWTASPWHAWPIRADPDIPGVQHRTRSLERVSERLSHHPALASVARTGRPWIDNAIASKPGRPGVDPTETLVRRGYRSRYVVRIQREQTLYGLIFFNSRRPGFFSNATVSGWSPAAA